MGAVLLPPMPADARPIYLDNNATTPVAPEVRAAMEPWLSTEWGNPSSGHAHGRAAADALARARAQVASLIGAEPGEILFTSGGTESDNLALLGQPRERGRLAISAVEHPAVEEPAELLERAGWEIRRLPVTPQGSVDPGAAAPMLEAGVDVLSVMTAQNETGVIQPVAALAKLARAAHPQAVVHTDAAQAVGKIPVNVDALGVDLLTIAGHKLYAPKGIGALYVRTGTALRPRLHGGGQERGLRPGTEPVPMAVALGEACAQAQARLSSEVERLGALKERLFAALAASMPGLVRSGQGMPVLPNTLHLRVPGCTGTAVLAGAPGVAASTGSACHADAAAPSGVLGAMGLSVEEARGALRLSLGRFTDEEQVDRAATELGAAWQRACG